MTVNYALYSGVSGLGSKSEGMSVISNNIANATTKGFKHDRAEFEDMLSVSINELSQMGRGSRLRNTTTLFTQGAVTTTGAITDLAVQGDGFFIVEAQSDSLLESNGHYYTRTGSFRFDKNGKLTDPVGNRVQGYMADEKGRLSSHLSDVEIISNSIPPRPTTLMNVIANLDVREKPPADEFNIEKPRETSNYMTTVTIYDNYGYGRECDIYFKRTGDDSKNEWEWFSTVGGADVSKNPDIGPDGKPVQAIIGKGTIEFDEDGKPILPYINNKGEKTFIDTSEQNDVFEVQFSNGAKAQKLQFNFGPQIDEDGNLGTQTSTSIAAPSNLSFTSQNGYEYGFLKTMKIDLDGTVNGIYTNGLERRLGAVGLATFANNQGLQKIGGNNFIRTPQAGSPQVGLAQSSSRGSIYSSSLEESNVDLARQFVEMITTQRGFQANSKSITTADQMLGEIIDLKR